MRHLPESTFHSALLQMIPDSSYDWCNPECVVEHYCEAAKSPTSTVFKQKANQ
jgi:hypothetical protein